MESLQVDIAVRQAELDRDKYNMEALINRYGGREHLLSSFVDGIQKEQIVEHIVPQNLEHDSLK